MPTALTELNNTKFCRARTDLTGLTQARLIVGMGWDTAGAPTAQFRAQYSLDGLAWSYLDGVDGPKIGINFVNDTRVTAWGAIVAAAQADVWLRVVGINGGNVSATFGNVLLEVR